MSKDDELPATVPQRRRAPAPSEHEVQTVIQAPPNTDRETLVASELAPASILEWVRRGTTERLDIEGRLAAGGMGAIDVAIDRALDRRVAMKSLHPQLRSEKQAVRMFLREARLTGLLDHPHIVPVYDIAEARDGQLFFTMKLVEGRTLAELAGTLPRGVGDTATLYMLLDVVARVCDALAFAHSKGVLHCDVKPANVMVGEFGQVFLMDWGIAKIMAADGGEEVTPSKPVTPGVPSLTDHSIIGTAAYMSPEQALGNRRLLDQRSDVFLLGALLYELLTQRPPYQTKDRVEAIMMAQAGIVKSPRQVAGELAVPQELDRIVMRAMAKAPVDRYPSVAALKDDLIRFMRGGAEFPRKTFSAGQVILQEGDTGDAAYIVVEGRCDVSKTMGGVVKTLHHIDVGGVFGEMAILTKSRRTATVTAAETTTVLVVTQQVLEQELAALKPWMATLLKSLAVRFRDIDTQHRATFAQAPSAPRVANQVLMYVMTWGENGVVGWTELLKELEAQLGTQPLSLFAAIARYGFVLDHANDRLTIPDLAKSRERIRADLVTAPPLPVTR